MNSDRPIDYLMFGELIVRLSKLEGISITHGIKSAIDANADITSYQNPCISSVFVKVYTKDGSQKIIDFGIYKKPSGEDFIHFQNLSDPLSYSDGFYESYESAKELMESSKEAFKLISDFLYEYLKSEVSGE